MHLEGSCQCGVVQFSLESDSPSPFMHCHCSICRKTGGSAGYGINIGGDAETLRVSGQKHVAHFHAVMREPGKSHHHSKAYRYFCKQCGTPLWLWDPRWPELVHPYASAIDTPLPKPPETVEIMLDDAPEWVDVPRGKGHRHFRKFPKESLREWHQRHGMLG